ncbi:hypothetical protein WR25_14966 isoform A [Diploscapter pachys]|uniref:BTB domain-containing protein n=1 Tax=Diploscapter pachys TaxID=2018661 RepID=A0A2A2LS87_9BILA|nr:hypothetical protein WR25_14966 isoform A [Diploscapter pachys]
MSHSFRSIFKTFGSKSKSNEVEEIVIEEQEENDLGDKDKEKNGNEAEAVKGIKQEPVEEEEDELESGDCEEGSEGSNRTESYSRKNGLEDGRGNDRDRGVIEDGDGVKRSQCMQADRADSGRDALPAMKTIACLKMDSSAKLVDRQFELDDFARPTVFRSTELKFAGGRSFFVSLDFLSEISEFFRVLNDGNKKSRFVFEDDSPESFLTFLRAVTPCPMLLPVDEFNISVLTDLSLHYAAWHLYAKCEEWLCSNMKELGDSEVVETLKAVYRRDNKERTFLCEQLIEFVAENFTFDQLDMFAAVDEQLSLLLYQRSSRALARRNNDLTKKLAMVKNNPALIDEIEIVEVRPGRKRVIEQGESSEAANADDGPPASKKTKLETVVICPRCADDKRKSNPRHNLSLVNLKCALCSRFRCTANCIRESTCKDGMGCASSKKVTQQNRSLAGSSTSMAVNLSNPSSPALSTSSVQNAGRRQMSTSLLSNPTTSPTVSRLHNFMPIYCFSLINFHFEDCDFRNYRSSGGFESK